MIDELRERERNRLLRRVDWRFLLQREGGLRSLCFATGRIAEAVEFVSVENAASAQRDLAVLVNPGSRQLQAAWDALPPGGEIYVEWRLPILGGVTRARRRLEAAKFENVRCYWPWPRPGRAPPKFWLPLDAPEAIAFFLGSRPGGIQLLGRLWRIAARVGVLAPICAVARKADGHDFTARPSLLLLTGGLRSSNKVVGLAFERSEAKPTFLIKFARSSSEEEPLRREADALRQLEAERPGLGGVPRVLALGRRSGQIALAQSFLGGEVVGQRLTGETFGKIATLVTDRLIELAGHARVEVKPVWWERLVEEPVARFERSFMLAPDEAARGRSILSTLGDLPLVFEHRDCAPWNILINDDEIGLVDWESSEPRGLPALDLVYFLTYGAFLVEEAIASGRAAEAYQRSLDPASVTGAVVQACEERYCDRFGLDPLLIGPLRLLCWALHSRSEYSRLRLDAGAPPVNAALRESLFLTLWREELRRDEIAAQMS